MPRSLPDPAATPGHLERPRARAVPTSTYRLQLHAGFGFAAAAGAVPYLAELGVSHLYLSPILQAESGSMHGYDVVDHSRVALGLGGETGLAELSRMAHDHDLGVIVDVVPNHMAVPTPLHHNPALWQTLRLGRSSASAGWFDIDWDLCDGRIGLPVLGAPLSEVVAAGDLRLVPHDGAVALAYYDQRFPLAPGTAGLAPPGSVPSGEHLADILDRQHYVLADWRAADQVLGYRRFFDVDSLIAIRVERPEVFLATHQLLLELYRRGVVDGFRIDHPDGLADPQGYLDMLSQATGGAWVVVEKILAGDEALPAAWATAGTTGYDALRAVQAALAPPTGATLMATWASVDGAPPTLAAAEFIAKDLVLGSAFQPELRRLARRAVDAAVARGEALVVASEIERGLSALLAEVLSYRAYLRLGEDAAPESLAALQAMRERALTRHPDLRGVLDLLLTLLTDTHAVTDSGRDLVVRFQQVCGPIMAKGVEDTTFYRYHPFIALNEVGGDPDDLLHGGVDALHAWAQRAARTTPLGMTTLTTHDTKRSEDIRARLMAIGEDAERWVGLWDVIRREARAHRVDEPSAYLLMQTLMGTWPLAPSRLDVYLTKALRESKGRTSWSDPNLAYEHRALDLGRALLESEEVTALLGELVRELAPGIRATTLAAKVLALTLPGVPDVYQGTELLTRSLVDPDNRRPVDYDDRRARLGALDAGAARAGLDDEKLWVTSRILRDRRIRPARWGADAGYQPVDAGSPHVVAFERGNEVLVAVTRWPVTASASAGQGKVPLGQGPRVPLGEGEWVDLLTDLAYVGGSPLPVRTLFQTLPVAVLVRTSAPPLVSQTTPSSQTTPVSQTIPSSRRTPSSQTTDG